VEAGHSCASQISNSLDWTLKLWSRSELAGCPVDSSTKGPSPALVTLGVLLVLEVVVVAICRAKLSGSTRIRAPEEPRETIEQCLPEIGCSRRWMVTPKSDEERERRTGVSYMKTPSATRFTVACKSGRPLQLISRFRSETLPNPNVPSEILHDFVWAHASVDASFRDILEQYWGALEQAMMRDSSFPQIFFYDKDTDGDELVPYQAQVDDWDTWKTIWDATRDLVRDMRRAWWVLNPVTRETPQIVANVRPKKARGRPQASSRHQQTPAEE